MASLRPHAWLVTLVMLAVLLGWLVPSGRSAFAGRWEYWVQDSGTYGWEVYAVSHRMRANPSPLMTVFLHRGDRSVFRDGDRLVGSALDVFSDPEGRVDTTPDPVPVSAMLRILWTDKLDQDMDNLRTLRFLTVLDRQTRSLVRHASRALGNPTGRGDVDLDRIFSLHVFRGARYQAWRLLQQSPYYRVAEEIAEPLGKTILAMEVKWSTRSRGRSFDLYITIGKS